MHHPHSGAQHRQPTGAFGGLMTLITARNTFSRWGGERPAGLGQRRRMGARPQEGLGGVGKRWGRDPDGGRGETGPGEAGLKLEGGRGGGTLGGGRGGLRVLSCLWLGYFDLPPAKPGRSGRAAAKPWSEEPGGAGRAAPPTLTPTHLLSQSRKVSLPGCPGGRPTPLYPLGAVLCVDLL